MDRYDNLDLDLECEGGGGGGGNVSQKAALFGGMFKKSAKTSEASDHQTHDISSTNKDLSNSNDSLTENNSKDKGTFKGMFKKTTKSAIEEPSQASLALPDTQMSASCESLDNKSSKDKSAGKTKKSPRRGHFRRHSQDLLEFNASNGSVPESSHSKESGGMFSGMFKKSPKPPEVKTQSQEDLSAAMKPSGSNDNLSENSSTKESGGMFGGMFKKKTRTKSQEDLLASNEESGSADNLSVNTSNKESGGMFGGFFKKSPKHHRARSESKEDLSASSELSGSKDNISVNANTKESGGMFSGMFKKTSKPFGARAQSQEDLSEPSELAGSKENLSENHTKEKGGLFSGVFRKKVSRAQSQEDLNGEEELSTDTDNNLEKPSKGGATRVLKNPFNFSSQDKEKMEISGDSNEDSFNAEKAKVRQNGFGAKMKSTFHTVKQEKTDDEASADDDEDDDNDDKPTHKHSKLAEAMTKLNPFRSNKHDKQSSSDEEDLAASKEKPSDHKQNAFVGAMSKLNPFRSAHNKDRQNVEALEEKEVREKPKPMKRNLNQPEDKERSETPAVSTRAAEKEMERVKPRWTKHEKTKSDDEDNDEKPLSEELQRDAEREPARMKKQKQPNPFRPRAADKAASDDEGLKEDDESSSKEDKNEEEGEEEKEKPKVRKVKKHNPFMPRVKGRVKKRIAQEGAPGDSAENEGANKSVFDQLDEYRLGSTVPANSENDQDVDLMDWWNTVESWEDMPQDEDMTEKEEAKAFAITAEKVQKGIRVFNKLFSERAESLWQHVIDLNAIADGLDKFNKNTKIAQITGGSTSAIGGVATITGLALAPVTMGTSLIVTAVGLGIATAGGLTSAGAGISNQVNNSMDRKKVEKIVEDYQEKIGDLNKCLKFIKQGIENLRRFDLMKMKNHAYNRDFPALTSSFYEDGAMAGKAILINANEIMRVVQIANVAGSTAARAVQIASMATGVLTGLFVGMDIYFVAKDSKILKKGAKSEFAAKIREVATQLHDGLVELNTIREELQSTTPENNGEGEMEPRNGDKKESDDKQYSSDEDEIDRIKKAIKKDYENREYV